MRLFRFFQELFFSLLETCLLFLAIGFVALQTETGREQILSWASHYLAYQSGVAFQVTSSTWDFPFTWTFQGVRLSKMGGSSLSIDHIQIHCALSEIAQGNLPFQIDIVGANSSWNIVLGGTWQSSGLQCILNRFEGEFGEFFQLQQPLLLSFSKEGFVDRPILFRLGQGFVQCRLSHTQEGSRLQVEANAFPPELLQLLLPGLPFATPLSIQGQLACVNQQIHLSEFSIREESGSFLSATGQAELSNSLPFQLHLTADHLLVVDSPYAKAWVKGEATLRGNKDHALLEGELEGEEVQIALDHTPPFSVPSIDFQYVTAPKTGTTAISPAFLEFDLHVKFPKKFFISSQPLQSEWKGNLHLKGPTNKLLFDGEVHLIKGEYALQDQKLRLSQGTLHLSGPTGTTSTLYLVMEKELERVRAELLVKGPVSDLKLSFRSSPPLPQREILSYLLFDRAIHELSSEQGEFVSDSFISLNQIQQAQSGDFFSKIKQKIGVIDRLGVNGEGLYLGKYLTKKLLVSFKKGISTLDNRFSVEAKLHKNLKAEAELNTGGEGEGKVSLKWKKEY